MTMYPFLTGFWISAGASSGIMFVLLYLHEARRGFLNGPEWLFTVVCILVYAAPLAGLWYAWQEFSKRRYRETTRSTLRRRFNGAIVGAIVIMATAYLLLPSVRF